MELEAMRSAACPIESSTRLLNENNKKNTTLKCLKGLSIAENVIQKTKKGGDSFTKELLNENNKKNTTLECRKGLSIAENVLMELEKAMGCKFIPKGKGISTAKTQTKLNKMQKTKKGGDSFTREPRKRTEICLGTEREIHERYLAASLKKPKNVDNERWYSLFAGGLMKYPEHNHEKCIEDRKEEYTEWTEEGFKESLGRCETPTPPDSEDEDDTDEERDAEMQP